MMDKFQIGDLVIFTKGGLAGKRATIMSNAKVDRNDKFFYDLECEDGTTGGYFAEYLKLEKSRDWGDGE